MARYFANRRPAGAAGSAASKWARREPPPQIARAIQRSAQGMSSPDDLLALQQAFGNKAVGSMIAGGKQAPGHGAVQRWPWDDMFGGGDKSGAGGAGGAPAKGGAGGADAKGFGGAGGAGGAKLSPHGGKGGGKGGMEDTPWGGLWKMYEGWKDDASGWGSPATQTSDGEAEREEEPWAAS